MVWAARSLARIATNAPKMASPDRAPPQARLSNTGGSPSFPHQSMMIATIGSAMRANVFQTPVTIADVETSRFLKPHERRIV